MGAQWQDDLASESGQLEVRNLKRQGYPGQGLLHEIKGVGRAMEKGCGILIYNMCALKRHLYLYLILISPYEEEL